MSKEFERQKNYRALAITGGVAGAILLMILLISWKIPAKHNDPPVEQFVEINLGSDLDGFGDDQPQLPGEGAPEQTAYTPTQPVQSAEESVKDIVNDDEKSNEAPVITKPTISKPDAKKINTESKTIKVTNPNPQPAIVQAPKPKTVMNGPRGGNSNGGNGADSYKRGGNEGDGNGPGDKGVNGGNPNGTQYSGTPKNFGVKVLSIPNQTFEDDFNTNAKVAMIVEINAAGKVTSATYTSKGSSGTATDKMKEIARRRAFELKLGSSEGGQKGTVVFNFVVKGGA